MARADGFLPLLEAADGRRFDLLLVDPPWAYRDEKSNGSAVSRYGTEELDAISEIPIGEIAAKDSILACWTTQVGLAEGWHLPVFAAWGFEPITVGFVWIKTYADGDRRYCGLGRYTRSGAEFVLLGRRGKGIPRASAAVRQILETEEAISFAAPVGSHSAKPDGLHRGLEELFGETGAAGDPIQRAEIFSRRPRAGWFCWGNEIDSESPMQLELL